MTHSTFARAVLSLFLVLGTARSAGASVVGCNADADCTGAKWCDEDEAICQPELPNGAPMPVDDSHSNPMLDGLCSEDAAQLVCMSGVCDMNDNECGYAAGDGDCSGGLGPVVCRSGACSDNGHCELAGGCNVDTDCPTGDWCMEATSTCMPQLANGQPIPDDPPHQDPGLDGGCTALAALVVCTSQVCDPADSECGFANEDGPCDIGNGSTVCRSGFCSADNFCRPRGGCNVDADCAGGTWCFEQQSTCTAQLPNGVAIPNDPMHADPSLDGGCTALAALLTCVSGVCDPSDDRCGFANEDGPCASNAACRSGLCSENNFCAPAGGCNVDADCPPGSWCSESSETCTPLEANGEPLPNDPKHSDPTLDGGCTAPAAELVCVSGVCDTDNACGYANGDGSCDSTSATTVCRSGLCSNDGHCLGIDSCGVDADCASGWCNEAAVTCTSLLANGQAIPSDPHRMGPTLNGLCTASSALEVCASGACDAADNECGYANGDGPCAGASVCRSGVCDSDNFCGFANGDGSCTLATAATVCRSGVCSADGHCEAAGSCAVDADCSGGLWCNEAAATCTMPLPNGTPIPTDSSHMNPSLTGTCTAAAGQLVCVSGVCDTADNACGYANGDGTCTVTMGPATVCRSGACSTNGKCEPANGCNVDADCPSPSSPVCGANHTCGPTPDAGTVDAGAPDAGVMDAGVADAGSPDAGSVPDAGAGTPDAGKSSGGSGGGCNSGGGLSVAALIMLGWLIRRRDYAT